MKKNLSLLLVGILVLGMSIAVFAQNNQNNATPTPTPTPELPLGEYPIGAYEEITKDIQIKPGSLLITALNWVFNGVLIISIIVLIYSGYLYATAGGDQAKTKKAMSTLIYAIIGIAIALSARAIVDLVSKSLSGKPIELKRTNN